MAPAPGVPATFPEPKVLDDFTPKDNSAYPWRSWADGRIRRFEKGVHYTSHTQSFKQNADKWAAKFGFEVEANRIKDNGKEYCELRITPKGGIAAPKKRGRPSAADRQQQLTT